MSGKGGRSRQGLGRIGQPPPGESFGPTSSIEDWFSKFGRAPETPRTPNEPAKSFETVVCKPAGYFSLGLLLPLEATFIARNFAASYASSGLTDIVPPNWTTSNSRVTVVTGWKFYATVPSIGGAVANGMATFANDLLAAGTIELQFNVPGGPILTHQPSGTGGKGGADELGGFGFFNEFWDDSPIEIFMPPKTRLKAQFKQIAAPDVTPIAMGFCFKGWELAQETFYAHVSGIQK